MRRWIRSTSGARAPLVHVALVCVLVACSSTEPPPDVGSIEVTPSTTQRQVGQTVQLSAAVKDPGGTLLSGVSVTWSSSAAAVASVSTSGLVTANALGTATISAANGSTSGVAQIQVIPEPISSISVAPTTHTLLVAQTVQIAATMRDAGGNVLSGRTPTWTTSSAAVATVSATGLVTGVGDGVATITAALDAKTATAMITVNGPCSTALVPTITVGQTVNGSLATTDCRLMDGSYADGYAITVTASTTVQIDMMSATFDTYLFLFELLPDGQLSVRAEHDDIDPGVMTNSRITFTLLPSIPYFILANSFDPGIFGDYQLKVVVSAGLSANRVVTGAPGRTPKLGKMPAALLVRPYLRR